MGTAVVCRRLDRTECLAYGRVISVCRDCRARVVVPRELNAAVGQFDCLCLDCLEFHDQLRSAPDGESDNYLAETQKFDGPVRMLTVRVEVTLADRFRRVAKALEVSQNWLLKSGMLRVVRAYEAALAESKENHICGGADDGDDHEARPEQ